MMFITPAFADDGAATVAANATGTLMSMLPIFLIIIVFYFMLSGRKASASPDHRKLIDNLQKGDKVVTGGGLVATVVKTIGNDDIVLTIADGVQVTALRSTIMMLRNPEQKK